MRIVLCYPVEPKHIRQIAAVHAGGRDRRRRPGANRRGAVCGRHLLRPCQGAGRLGRRGPRRAGLRWIQSSAAGMDHCLVPSVIESEIVVTSASGVLADQVAEHTIALVTGWCRSLPAFFRAQQQKEFIRRPTRDLHGARWGLSGFGGVGRRLARLLSGFRRGSWPPTCFPSTSRSMSRPSGRPSGSTICWPQSDIVVLCIAAERHDPGDHRRASAGADEARRRCWSTWPAGRWWSRATWSRPCRAGIWPGR